MSLEMITKDRKTTPIDGEFDDEEMMKLFASFDIAVKSRAGEARPLLTQLEALGRTKLDALRRQYFVDDSGEESEQSPAWQDPKELLAALRSFRKTLDHEGAPYLVQQIWADQRKPPPDPPRRDETDELIEAIDDMIARVQKAITRKAAKVRLCFDPALL